ncbi:MAG: crossover junction endodeoxyribonuclease RuvC [Terriglobales bacterium]
MRVLGIDCGGQATGLGVVETGADQVRGRDARTHRAVSHGVIRAQAGEALPQRLDRIHRGITAAILEHRPEWVAIEDIFYAENARSALKLGHVRGVAMQAAAAQGIGIAEYTPLEVKSALTGYGRAGKEQVRHMVARLLGIPETGLPLDASDALAVAICHLHAFPARQREETWGAGRPRGASGRAAAGQAPALPPGAPPGLGRASRARR